jgi:hypothetical protein
MRRAAAGCAALVAACVRRPAVGGADTTTLVEESGARLRVAAEAGHDNDITGVRLVTGVFEISDRGDRVVAGSGCVGVDADTVRCQTAGITSLGIDIADRDDRVDAAVSIATSPSSGATEPTGCGRPATPP